MKIKFGIIWLNTIFGKKHMASDVINLVYFYEESYRFDTFYWGLLTKDSQLFVRSYHGNHFKKWSNNIPLLTGSNVIDRTLFE